MLQKLTDIWAVPEDDHKLYLMTRKLSLVLQSINIRLNYIMISNWLLNIDCNYDFIAKKAEMHGIFTAKVKDEFPSIGKLAQSIPGA